MWKPDGWGPVARIGLLTPHASVGGESELQAMAPQNVVIHAARIPFGAMEAGGKVDPTIPLPPVRALAEPPHVDEAAELLAAAPLDAIGYGFTSSAYVIGAEGESAMLSRLGKRTRNIPLTATCSAAVLALRALGVERLTLVHPPWFDEELDAMGAAYFRGQGFDVVSSGPAGLPSDQQQVEPSSLYDWVRQQTPVAADGVFIGGNGFRAVGVIGALEPALGHPVVTANQALFWALLGLSDANHEVAGYGRLFERSLPRV
jgi:maleate isomerase